MAKRLTLDEAADLYAAEVEASEFPMPTLMLGLRDGTTTSINLSMFPSYRSAIRTLTERVVSGMLAEVQWALFSCMAEVAQSSDPITRQSDAFSRDPGMFSSARQSGATIYTAITFNMVDRDDGVVFHTFRPYVRTSSGLVVWQHHHPLGEMDLSTNPVGVLLTELVAASVMTAPPGASS